MREGHFYLSSPVFSQGLTPSPLSFSQDFGQVEKSRRNLEGEKALSHKQTKTVGIGKKDMDKQPIILHSYLICLLVT